MSVHEKMTAIADAIREKTGSTEKLNLDAMAQGVAQVYDAGQQSEYDRFWDACQENGNRTDYMCGFGGYGWTAETFWPKYDIRPVSGYMMFRSNCAQIDLVERLAEQGVVLDTSNMTAANYMFQNCRFTHIGTIDFRNAENTMSHVFDSCPFLVTIDLVKMKEDGSQDVSTAFTYIRYLENIAFEGVIGSNISFRQSTRLSKASITSIIGALSTTASGKTLTLSETAVRNAFGWDGDSQDYGTAWQQLIGQRENWTISLV